MIDTIKVKLQDCGKLTQNTRVILSFGAASGGFEFAMQLRKDIMDVYNKKWEKDLSFVYLDAESLKGESGTMFTWDNTLGIYKMSNEKWAKFYKDAMSQCDYMIFLLSDPWLSSQWCWQEFEWYYDTIKTKNITPILLVFKDAQKYLDPAKVGDNKADEKVIKLKKILSALIEIKGCVVCPINSDPDPALGQIEVEGQTYKYTYRYTCTEEERSAILNSVRLTVLPEPKL
jgi:hypothetical protein